MRERIADGVWLEDGDVDARPASIAWVSDGYVEAAGINDNLLVIVGNEIKAVDLSDRSVLWTFEGIDGDPLEASGGVQISVSSDSVEVFAPFEYHVSLERQTGRLLESSTSVPADPPPGFTRLRGAPPAVVIETDLEETIGHAADGRIAWKIVVDSPQYDEGRPIQFGDVVILPLSSGHIVALRLQDL